MIKALSVLVVTCVFVFVLFAALSHASGGASALLAAPADARFVVNSALDTVDASPGDGQCLDASNQCTLRAAVMEANAQAVASFSSRFTITLPSTLTLVFPLYINGVGEEASASGDLDIKSNLTIEGRPGVATIDGSLLNDRVLDIFSVYTVRLANIVVRHGVSSAVGAGISNGGALVLDNVSVLSNTSASRVALGGGIYNSGRIEMLNSVVRGNLASGASPTTTVAGRGAGIYNLGHLTMTSSSVLSNSLVVSGTGGDGSGAGIYNINVDLVMSASVIAGNVITANGGTTGYGAGLYNYQSAAALISSTVRANRGADRGGGIYVYASTVSLERSTIGFNSSLLYGGGIDNPNGIITLSRSTVAFNQSFNGGGIHNAYRARVLASTVYANEAANGGGLYNDGVLTVTNSTLYGNKADDFGGALYNSLTTTLNSATVWFNFADFDHNATGAGGGLFNVNVATARVAMHNTLLYNFDFSGHSPDCANHYFSTGYNIVSDGTQCLITIVSGVDFIYPAPPIGFLLDNGGPTWTAALPLASVAVDHADPAGCRDEHGALLATDQRGLGRHVDADLNGSARCDVGAFEVQLPVYLPLIRR
ncbi:MAG: CSLREA domain-containing protein [Chloroflexi bacterium]|nr:CSLREA domain-containing protein [Chloroflexota bacterium]